jgi:hypothetical protein
LRRDYPITSAYIKSRIGLEIGLSAGRGKR